jgi:hypothetical protein
MSALVEEAMPFASLLPWPSTDGSEGLTLERNVFSSIATLENSMSMTVRISLTNHHPLSLCLSSHSYSFVFKERSVRLNIRSI